jgi:hypothetical protein
MFGGGRRGRRAAWALDHRAQARELLGMMPECWNAQPPDIVPKHDSVDHRARGVDGLSEPSHGGGHSVLRGDRLEAIGIDCGARAMFTAAVGVAKRGGRSEAVLGEEFDSKLSKRTVLTERLSFYPNLSHTGDYRFQFDSTVSTQLKNWLSWQFTFTDHYISYPPPGLLGNDILLSTGLRVTWGKAKL